MNVQDLDTDASMVPPGAVGGDAGDSGTNTHIQYHAKDGSKFFVNTSGKAPQMQVGHGNVMYVSSSSTASKGKTSGKKTSKKAKKPLITSTDIPGSQSMDIVASSIGKDWRMLGRALRLSDGQLDNTKMDYATEGQYEVSYQMIRKWKEMAYPTQLAVLASTCDKIGRGDIADELYDMVQAGES